MKYFKTPTKIISWLRSAHMGTLTNKMGEEAFKQLEADAQALWAVRVLDAWADEVPSRSWETRRADSSVDVRACCVLRHARIECHFGSFDTARLAAAEAVWPTLTDAQRAEIGEKP